MALVGSGVPGGPKQAAFDALSRAQSELERAVEEIDRLPAIDVHSVALAAHALGNFLTVSRGVVDLLIPVLQGHPERQVGVWLEGLAHATDLMTHTVSQLMNNAVGVSRSVRIETVDLTRLIERACAYYRRRAALKRIDVVFQTAGDVPTVQTDRVLVAAIVDNLLSNAVKFSPSDRRIWVDVRRERDGVVCDVRDEGPGLSDTDQARLFEPGQRLGATPSGGEPTTGYGLAVARSFADQLGGQLRCRSVLGRGATFSLWLPGVPPHL
jgi:two-component system, sensor histidine kinase LadS